MAEGPPGEPNKLLSARQLDEFGSPVTGDVDRVEPNSSAANTRTRLTAYRELTRSIRAVCLSHQRDARRMATGGLGQRVNIAQSLAHGVRVQRDDLGPGNGNPLRELRHLGVGETAHTGHSAC